MKLILTGTLLLLGSLALPVVSAQADDSKSGNEPPAGQVEETVGANPYMDDLQKSAEALIEGLEENGLKTLYDIRHMFGMTRSIRVVHNDVDKAVGLCAEEHEGLKEEITGRFAAWEKAVMRAVEDTEGKMQLIIEAQTFRPASEIREYLRLTKEAADYTESQIDKKPVTTEDACRSLIKSMDKTQETLTGLLVEVSESAEYPVKPDEGKEVAE